MRLTIVVYLPVRCKNLPVNLLPAPTPSPPSTSANSGATKSSLPSDCPMTRGAAGLHDSRRAHWTRALSMLNDLHRWSTSTSTGLRTSVYSKYRGYAGSHKVGMSPAIPAGRNSSGMALRGFALLSEGDSPENEERAFDTLSDSPARETSVRNLRTDDNQHNPPQATSFPSSATYKVRSALHHACKCEIVYPRPPRKS